MKRSSKHEEMFVDLNNFTGGLNEESASPFLQPNELSDCSNFKFINPNYPDKGNVELWLRGGITRFTTAALGNNAVVTSCTYVRDWSKLIYTGASVSWDKIYYTSAGSGTNTEIGNINGTYAPRYTFFHDKLIVHDHTSTKAINSSQTMETLACRYDDQIIETGDGTTTNFTGSLTNVVVSTSSITITYYDSAGVAYTITDNGAGALVGAVNGGGTNTINYTTGAYDFTCSATPANASTVLASYKKTSGCPSSNFGLVRGERLYLFSLSSNRVYYSGVNDEYAWDESSGGGYFDIAAPNGSMDCYIAGGAAMTQDSMLIVTDCGVVRVDGYPEDAMFRVYPICDKVTSTAYNSIIGHGNFITFMTDKNYVAVDLDGSVIPLGNKIRSNIAGSATADVAAVYFSGDNQIWIAPWIRQNEIKSGGTHIYILSMDGHQASKYRYYYSFSCFNMAESSSGGKVMYIGATDGHVYVYNGNNTSFVDNSQSYSTHNYLTTSDIDCGMPYNSKLLKEIYLDIVVSSGTVTGNIDLYIDESTSSAQTIAISASKSFSTRVRHRFNKLKIKLSAIAGSTSSVSVKIKGIRLRVAPLGL